MAQTLPFADENGPLAHLNDYKNNINHAHLVKNYQDGDDYTAVTTTKSVANIAISAPDMVITDSNGDKVLTINAKSGLAKTQDSDTHAVGTATSGNNTSLTDSGASFGVLTAKVVHIKSGAGAGKSAKITGNTGTVLNFADIGVTLDNTSQYEVLDDLVVAYVDTANSRIKLIKEETTDQAISASNGNSVNISANTHTVKKAVNVA